MSSYGVDLPARRTAWLADHAYQLRLTEQARTLAAVESDIRPTQLRLAAAMMPDTRENAQLADRDEVWVRFIFCATEIAAGQLPQRREPRRAARGADTEQN